MVELQVNELSPKEKKRLEKKKIKEAKKQAKLLKKQAKLKKEEAELEIKQVDLSKATGVSDAYLYDQSDIKVTKDFATFIEISDVKAILLGIKGQPILLANGYGEYLQIMEILGKDIATLSEAERLETIASYTQWLAGTMFDIQLQATRLPTNTAAQIDELMRVLRITKLELANPNHTDREIYQLKQKLDILATNIVKLEIVSAMQYNTEFFVWIFADTLEALEANTRTACSITRGFVPQPITVAKKTSLIRQYYNYNDPVDN